MGYWPSARAVLRVKQGCFEWQLSWHERCMQHVRQTYISLLKRRLASKHGCTRHGHACLCDTASSDAGSREPRHLSASLTPCLSPV